MVSCCIVVGLSKLGFCYHYQLELEIGKMNVESRQYVGSKIGRLFLGRIHDECYQWLVIVRRSVGVKITAATLVVDIMLHIGIVLL